MPTIYKVIAKNKHGDIVMQSTVETLSDRDTFLRRCKNVSSILEIEIIEIQEFKLVFSMTQHVTKWLPNSVTSDPGV
jgi:hypothetical protein